MHVGPLLRSSPSFGARTQLPVSGRTVTRDKPHAPTAVSDAHAGSRSPLGNIHMSPPRLGGSQVGLGLVRQPPNVRHLTLVAPPDVPPRLGPSGPRLRLPHPHGQMHLIQGPLTRPCTGCPPGLWPPNCAMVPSVPPTVSTTLRAPTPTLNTSLGSPVFGPRTWGRRSCQPKTRCLTPTSSQAPCATPGPAHARGRPTANVVRRTRVEATTKRRRCPTHRARPIGRVPPLLRRSPQPHQVGPSPRNPGPVPIHG